jgi:hypothetical protein
MKDNKYSEESLSDIASFDSENENGEKTKKILFVAIIAAVILVILFVVISSFTSEDEISDNIATEFIEDDSEPFFMDSPADGLEPIEEEVDEEVVLEEDSNDGFIEPIDSVEPVEIVEDGNDIVVEEELPSLPTIPDPMLPAPTPSLENTPTVEHPRALVEIKRHYIQTGTFLKNQPNEKYLQKIKDLGFDYYIDTYITSSGKEITRVLVGPFATLEEGESSLQKVKDGIEESSFLITTRLH